MDYRKIWVPENSLIISEASGSSSVVAYKENINVDTICFIDKRAYDKLQKIVDEECDENSYDYSQYCQSLHYGYGKQVAKLETIIKLYENVLLGFSGRDGYDKVNEVLKIVEAINKEV